MRTLLYKRTHTGDPDDGGRFGIHGCMGRVRAWDFEAVIGVGGLGAEPTSHGIDGRVTWIGIGPHRHAAKDRRGPLVTFDHFLYYGEQGPLFRNIAPALANRMLYDNNARTLMDSLSREEQREVNRPRPSP